jgi:hypothetical protein
LIVNNPGGVPFMIAERRRSARMVISHQYYLGKGMSMDENEYMKQRVDDQISWYEEKSAWNQSRYKRLRMTEFSCAALIPFLSGMGDKIPGGAWLIGILGVAIAIAAAAGSIYKFHETWIQYRTTVELLKYEKFMFLTGSGPYANADKFTTLVERVENLISKENSTWAELSSKTDRATQDI